MTIGATAQRTHVQSTTHRTEQIDSTATRKKETKDKAKESPERKVEAEVQRRTRSAQERLAARRRFDFENQAAVRAHALRSRASRITDPVNPHDGLNCLEKALEQGGDRQLLFYDDTQDDTGHVMLVDSADGSMLKDPVSGRRISRAQFEASARYTPALGDDGGPLGPVDADVVKKVSQGELTVTQAGLPAHFETARWADEKIFLPLVTNGAPATPNRRQIRVASAGETATAAHSLYLPMVTNNLAEVPPPRRPTPEEGVKLSEIERLSFETNDISDEMLEKRDQLRVQVEGLRETIVDVHDDGINHLRVSEDDVDQLVEEYTAQWEEDDAVFADGTPLEREDELAAKHGEMLDHMESIPDDLLASYDPNIQQLMVTNFTNATLSVLDGTGILDTEGNTGSLDSVDGSRDPEHIRRAADQFVRLVDQVGADAVKQRLGEDVYNRTISVLVEEVGTTYVREFENETEAALKAHDAFENEWRAKLGPAMGALGSGTEVSEAWDIMRGAARVANKGEFDNILRRLDRNPLGSGFAGYTSLSALVSLAERSDNAGEQLRQILVAAGDGLNTGTVQKMLLKLGKATGLRNMAELGGKLGLGLAGISDALAAMDSAQRGDLWGTARDAAFAAGNFLPLIPRLAKIGGRFASSANLIAAAAIGASTIHDIWGGIQDQRAYESANRSRLQDTFRSFQVGSQFDDWLDSDHEGAFQEELVDGTRTFKRRLDGDGYPMGHDYVRLENVWAIWKVPPVVNAATAESEARDRLP